MIPQSDRQYVVPSSTYLSGIVPAEKINVVDGQIQNWIESACRNCKCDSLC